LVTGILFLELNRFDFRASEADATQAVMGLAAGTLDEAGYVDWLRENSWRKRGKR
jgi:prophage maintenance system killer protein